MPQSFLECRPLPLGVPAIKGENKSENGRSSNIFHYAYCAQLHGQTVTHQATYTQALLGAKDSQRHADLFTHLANCQHLQPVTNQLAEWLENTANLEFSSFAGVPISNDEAVLVVESKKT